MLSSFLFCPWGVYCPSLPSFIPCFRIWEASITWMSDFYSLLFVARVCYVLLVPYNILHQSGLYCFPSPPHPPPCLLSLMVVFSFLRICVGRCFVFLLFESSVVVVIVLFFFLSVFGVVVVHIMLCWLLMLGCLFTDSWSSVVFFSIFVSVIWINVFGMCFLAVLDLLLCCLLLHLVRIQCLVWVCALFVIIQLYCCCFVSVVVVVVVIVPCFLSCLCLPFADLCMCFHILLDSTAPLHKPSLEPYTSISYILQK